MKTAPFCAGDPKKAKVLVIGHDPRLQISNTLAGHTFFADYYFKPISPQRSERAKYKLAEAVFDYVSTLTNQMYSAEQVVLTNLCNTALPHAPKGKTVYIPEEEACQGIQEIEDILKGSEVQVILAMSLQVNYWLQTLGFYPAVKEFLIRAEPKERGVTCQPPYYEPARGRAFLLICGKQYHTKDRRSIFPVLHVKHWPLKGRFAEAYAEPMETCINAMRSLQ